MIFLDYKTEIIRKNITTMAVKKLLMALFIFGISTAYNITNGFVVKNIHFEGLQRISIGTAINYIPISTKSIVTNKDISNIIKSLFATKYFEDIRVFYKNESLIIKVKEYPIISNITFYGNKILKKEMLKKNFDIQGVQVGNLLNNYVIHNIKKEIEEFYYSLGKYTATVEVKINPLPFNRVNLNFIFTEGVSAKIKQINIIGNHAFSDNILKSYFHLYDKLSWWDILKNKEYQKQKLVYDLKLLHKFYTDRGYVNFIINSTQLNLTPDKKHIYITLYVNEGKQYKLLKIMVNGKMRGFSRKIKYLAKIQPGILYNRSKINDIENNIKQLMGSYGYINTNIVTNLEINDINKTINLYINVDIGHKFYVRHIYFKGNKITKDYVLRREIRQMEGTWLDINLINQGKERLDRLGYFEFVNIKIQRIPDLIDQVDIIYIIKERNTGSINLGIGFGTESKTSFHFSTQQDNWLGTGNIISLNGFKNNYQTHTELSITDLYFTFDGISLSSKIFYNRLNADRSDLSDYNLRTYGTGFMLGFPVNEHNSLNFGLDYVHNDLANMKPRVTMWHYLNSIKIYPKLITINKINNNFNFSVNDFFVSMGWVYNNLNRGYFPSTGSLTSLTNKLVIPILDNEYYKIMFNTSYYIPLSKNNKWVFMERLHAGYAVGIRGKHVPFYDNFYIGGANIIRGFRSNTIGPKAFYYNFNNCDTVYGDCPVVKSNDNIGGNAMFVASFGFIFPTPFLDEKYTNLVRTSLFIDAGTIWYTNWQNNIFTKSTGIPDYSDYSKIRISSGIELQWISPLGPLTFSYAKAIKKYDGDKLERFQFNIGKTW